MAQPGRIEPFDELISPEAVCRLGTK